VELRRRFWAAALVRGWQQVVSLIDHLGVAVALAVGAAAAFGISFAIGGPWWSLGVALAICCAVVLDGAFLAWKDQYNIASATGDPQARDVERAIAALKERRIRVRQLRDQEPEFEDFEFLFAIDLADRLATGGLTPEYDGSPEFYSERVLRAVLGELRIQGMVDVQRRVEERDRGYPHTVEDFFLNDFGARVLREIQRRWEQEEQAFRSCNPAPTG
jgi:hypothetical protein